MSSLLNTSLLNNDNLASIREVNFNKSNVNNNGDSFPALKQGKKFKNYQTKIKNNLKDKINYVNSKEGFSGLNLTPNGLAEKSKEIINKNKLTNYKESSITNLQQTYGNTIQEYENTINDITNASTSYINRVSSSNPYLGKNINFGNGNIMYVTQQGIAKWYPSADVMNNTAGQNGCPSSSQTVNVNVPWSSSYENAGVTIPTKPNLLTGTPMVSGQSCGNEGANVFVDTLLTDVSSSYVGCYQDNTNSPTMTFVGGAPTVSVVTVQNPIFSQPQLQSDSYQYIESYSTVPGWYFNAVLINNSSAWGYPTPYPAGSQAACIQGTQNIAQNLYFNSGTYFLSFFACGRPGYSGANTIDIFFYVESSDTSIFTFTPPTTSWQNYSVELNVPNNGNYYINFVGTINSQNNSTAIQDVEIYSSGDSTTGTYSYDQCKQTAIQNESKYFAIQNVNPSTGLGFCAVSNDEPSITQYGNSYVPTGQKMVWSSNTSGQTGNSAILSITGSLSVINSSGQAVFNTPNSTAQPSNYLGCYGDSPNRAMTIYNNGAQSYNLNQCQQIAQQNGYSLFGLQNSTSGSYAQCALSNDLAQASEYGPAGNCTKIPNGTWSGGGYSNALYNTNSPQSNYVLIVNDNGIYIQRGTSPSDYQGTIWQFTFSQDQQNSNYVALNGIYGQNWITQGQTLAAGNWIGSPNGYCALMMQADGNLALYTFSNQINCQKLSNGKMAGGEAANALYSLSNVGVTANMGQMGYVDPNAELHVYSSNNMSLTNSYTQFNNMAANNPIQGESFNNSTIDQCKSYCNGNPDCYGFTFTENGGICMPQGAGMYPDGEYNYSEGVSTFVRNRQPTGQPAGIPDTTTNIDSVMYQNYVDGGAFGNSYGLASLSETQKQQLNSIQNKLNGLAQDMTNWTNGFSNGTNVASNQMVQNVRGLGDYLTQLKSLNGKVTNFDTSVDNILNDSDITVLQNNYNYLFWSILAMGTIMVTMNIAKK